MMPLFGESEETLQQEMSMSAPSYDEEVGDLSTFYRVEAPDDKLDDLSEKLMSCDCVDSAYVKPAAELCQESDHRRGGMVSGTEMPQDVPYGMPLTAEGEMVAGMTPNYTADQLYLKNAPQGIDAHFAWNLRGGRGQGVGVIDIEGGWLFSHEDLRANQGGVVGGTPTTNQGWLQHGTAVVGVIGGDPNRIGITGIAPRAMVRAVSIFPHGTAWAIRHAANLSKPGDILLLEVHRAGPRFNFQPRADQKGYIAIEWWPDDYAAIRHAVNRGVIVVEAAGNGAENLSDPLYNTRPNGFPNDWRNPFNRRLRDSGAVVVGAGAPPPGFHGMNHGPDRSRLGFSNYGSLVDAQGWGREVTTTGYGDLQGGPHERWYTRTFSGTSSASPIVVGALACVQGVLRAHRRVALTPARARSLLRTTGSPQVSAPTRPRSQRIGNRPNLRQLIRRALHIDRWVGTQFRGTLAPHSAKRWRTSGWPAHWHVDWRLVPVTPRPGRPQIQWSLSVERTSDRQLAYWLTARNLTPEPVNIEARYAILGW